MMLRCVTGFVGCMLLVGVAMPVSAQEAAKPKAEFDAVSIKPNKSGSGHSHVHGSSENANMSGENVSVKILLEEALHVPDTQIAGIPAELASARFDFQAKADATLNERIGKMTPKEADALREQMLLAMMQDRFKLVVHRETREMPVYALVVGKGGAKMAVSKETGDHVVGRRGSLEARGLSAKALANELGGWVGRVVVDKTGLSGTYDFLLKWTPADSAPVGDDAPPSIFTAVQEQLGLKLESQKGPVEMLVIDRVEMPAAD